MIRADIITISTDIARAKPLFDQDRERFRQFLTAQASLRGLPAAVMIDKNLDVVERSNIRTQRWNSSPRPKPRLRTSRKMSRRSR